MRSTEALALLAEGQMLQQSDAAPAPTTTMNSEKPVSENSRSG